MRIGPAGEVQITHGLITRGLDIRAAEAWLDVRAGIAATAPLLKAEISPQAPLGIYLRLSAFAARQLAQPSEMASFRDFLTTAGLYVFGVDTRAFGARRGRAVKDAMYRPDWTDPERLDYSDRAARIMAQLAPSTRTGTVATIPGLLAASNDNKAAEQVVFNLLRHVATLLGVERRTGCQVVLALNPEPGCLISNAHDAVRFFHQHLLGRDALAYLAELCRIGIPMAAAVIRRHIGVSYDLCNAAVAYEDPLEALTLFADAGIRVLELRLSSALHLPRVGTDARALLMPYEDGVRLRQVAERRDGAIHHYLDLGPALKALDEGRAGGEWRVRCQIGPGSPDPIGMDAPKDALRNVLAVLRERAIAPNLIVEADGWEYSETGPLPLSRAGIVASSARDLRWVLNEFATARRAAAG